MVRGLETTADSQLVEAPRMDLTTVALGLNFESRPPQAGRQKE